MPNFNHPVTEEYSKGFFAAVVAWFVILSPSPLFPNRYLMTDLMRGPTGKRLIVTPDHPPTASFFCEGYLGFFRWESYEVPIRHTSGLLAKWGFFTYCQCIFHDFG